MRVLRNVLEAVCQEMVNTLKSPLRILSVVNYKVLKRFVNDLRISVSEWSGYKMDEGINFRKRDYQAYEDYITHQKSKMEMTDMTCSSLRVKVMCRDKYFREALRGRLRKLKFVNRGKSVLCLGARLGTEVKAFQDLGCFAVGIDLYPDEKNSYVLYGDFNNIKFPDESVDIVYNNSLDHCFDIKILIEEVKRVLKKGGVFIVEAVRGSGEGGRVGRWESFYWSRIDDLVRLICSYGIVMIREDDIEYPWKGKQVCFMKERKLK